MTRPWATLVRGSVGALDDDVAARCLRAAVRLHHLLQARHWDGRGLTGPDPGIRVNYRLGRFVKSALPALPWRDGYYYLQAQGYWILANSRLYALSGDVGYLDVVAATAREVAERQPADGAWRYPNREWAGRVATAEGTWASLGLLEAYGLTGDRVLLDAAERWYGYLVNEIGFQGVGDGLAVNYFAGRPGSPVPNNSAFVLRFMAELATATGDHSVLRESAPMVEFLRASQLPSGELPYEVAGPLPGRHRTHFQCYQYNAYECLDLMRYAALTGDVIARGVADAQIPFLATGIAADGHAAYACLDRHRAVTYHATVLAAALARGAATGRPGYELTAERAYEWAIRAQRADGGFPYSRGDYRALTDTRSYPRGQSMILYHLLEPATLASGD